MTNIRAITVLVATVVSAVVAQVPNIGWCPDYLAMPEFDMERFVGTWYEQERYFAILEAGSRCVRTNYTQAVDGRILVSNEVTNRLTGIKRVLEGEIRDAINKRQDARINVKYTTLPYPFETTYTILDTDYDNYAVIWSCSGLGLVNTQNAWIMTRERLAPGTVLQRAYGVLDRFKINRAFFVKTDQAECQIAEAISENDVNKEGADKNKEEEDKNKRNRNNEKGSVKSAAGVVAEPVDKEQQQQPAEPQKPAVVAVNPVVKQDQPAAVQSDAAPALAPAANDKPAMVEAVKEPVVADPVPVKQTSVAAEAVKKQ